MDSQVFAGLGIGFLIVFGLITLLVLISKWIVVSKGGQLGVSQIIPIWSTIALIQVAKKPMWWLVMILIVPFANIVFAIMLLNAVAAAFGKGAGFTVGLIFLPFIFWPILAFGDAEYQA